MARISSRTYFFAAALLIGSCALVPSPRPAPSPAPRRDVVAGHEELRAISLTLPVYARKRRLPNSSVEKRAFAHP